MDQLVDLGIPVFALMAPIIAAFGAAAKVLRAYERAMVFTLGRFKAVRGRLRYLKTLTEIGAEQNSTVIFPMPLDIVKPFLEPLDAPAEATIRRPRLTDGQAALALLPLGAAI